MQSSTNSVHKKSNKRRHEDNKKIRLDFSNILQLDVDMRASELDLLSDILNIAIFLFHILSFI